MVDFEKLGVFYLGRLFDLKGGKAREDLLLYDAKDLVTHAVCVGMTGSGKTGLCISLIEEAAIDGIPAILIDPKGDLCDLLLAFPQLRGEDFQPWVNPDDARQRGLSVPDFASQEAERWKKGLAGWGQSGERIQKYRDAADFKIYTPGSTAGIPVSILASFAAPSQDVIDDREWLRDRISTTVTSLLGLIGVEADPVKSREHILLSTIFNQAWQNKQDLDLAGLIQQVQKPPVSKIGVLDLESFYPSKERYELVLMLNNLLASPGFETWLEGVPLDIGKILYTPQGKPSIAVFSIAHLGDAERMFFVSLLFNQVLGWMRAQSGTTSLRAILYMDEIFGYLPPVSNPPSKLPLMTLLKQARAFGLGIVLATQNPVDVDYKALSNTGTWFIGRLQTERDKARLLEGLEGAAATAGGKFDRQAMEQTIAGLGNRVFLMNNTHEDAPTVFTTRWALSYLRGPLTREQIKVLMAGKYSATGQPTVVSTAPVGAGAKTSTTSPATTAASAPALPPGVQCFYVPPKAGAGTLTYQPQVLGVARVRFSDAKLKVDLTQESAFATPVTDEAIPVRWENARALEATPDRLTKSPAGPATYTALPPAAGQAKNYVGWSRDFTAWLSSSQQLELMKSPSTGEISRPGEKEADFRVRLGQKVREQRDLAVETLRKKYASKLATAQERVTRAQVGVDREKSQASQQGLSTAVSIGATLLGAFTGRKLFSSSNLSRASSAVRRATQSAGAGQDVARAGETLKTTQQQLADLQAQFESEAATLQSKIDPLTEVLEAVTLRPKKTDISVQLVALAWVP